MLTLKTWPSPAVDQCPVVTGGGEVKHRSESHPGSDLSFFKMGKKSVFYSFNIKKRAEDIRLIMDEWMDG